MLIQDIRKLSNVLVNALKKLTRGSGSTNRLPHDLPISELLVIPLELTLQILSYLNTTDILKCRLVHYSSIFVGYAIAHLMI